MARVRVGVVGTGAISQEHLGALACDDRVELAAVCDLSLASARFASRQYGGVAYTDLGTMLDEVRPQTVHVLTPPSSHFAIVNQCLDAGCNVICEKPLAASLSETIALLDRADQLGLHVIESQNLRFNDPILALGRLIDDGTIGDIVKIEIVVALDVADPTGKFADPNIASPVRGLPGGVVHDFLPHLAYLAIQWIGFPEPDRVTAIWQRQMADAHLGCDTVDAIATFGATTATLAFSTRARPDCFRVVVRGTKSTAETDLYRPFHRLDRARGPRRLSTLINYATNGVSLAIAGARDLRDKALGHTPYHGIGRMLGAYYSAIIDGRELPITRLHVERTAVLIDALVAAIDDPGLGRP